MNSFSDFVKGHRPLVCGHRGAKALFPENTSAGFEKAKELRVDLIETDVRLTKDGHLVIFHDETLDRTTNMTGPVRSFTLDELKNADAGYRFAREDDFPFRDRGLGILTLDEMLEACAGFWISIDMKDNDAEAARTLAGVLEKHNRHDSVLVGSFHPPVIEYFRKLAPRVANCASPSDVKRFFVHMFTFTLAFYNPGYECFQLPVEHRGKFLLSRRIVKAAHSRNIAVIVWTVNDEATIKLLMDMDVDGIISDNPELLMRVAEERK